jgi:hypothetical protein
VSDACRSCKAPVRWAVGPNGNLMILDADPSARGNVRLETVAAGEHQIPRAVIVPKASRDEYAGQLYLVHHATCPDADQWRKNR